MLISTFWPPQGGVQNQLYKLAQGLLRAGHEVHVVMRRQQEDAPYQKVEGMNIYSVPICFKNSPYFPSLCYTFYALLWLIKNRRRYDIIHCHQSYSPATAGILGKLLLGKKVIVKVTASNEYGEVNELKRLPFFNIRKILFKAVDRFIFINPQVKKELMGIGVAENKLQYIPNGVSTIEGSATDKAAKQGIRKKLDLPYSRIGIYTGRLSEEKSLETVLFAWKICSEKIPDAHFLFLGEGGNFRNVENTLKKLSDELGLQKVVHFLGNKKNVSEYLLASDIFILPSVSEGMSNSLLEAMAAGLAVIASNIDANRNILRHNENGVLFERKDSAQLAVLIETLLTNQAQAEQLGREARSSIQRDYAIESVLEKYLSLYKTLLVP